MTTIQDVIGDYTPLSNKIVKKLKLTRGALACKIFYTSNLRDRICRMGLKRIADELGIDDTTASKGIKWLVENEYIEQVKAPDNRHPGHYRCTQKFYDLSARVDIINSRVDYINSRVDYINQEEDIKEESKEKTIAILDSDFAEISRAYENSIGFIGPAISDILKEWLSEYPRDWILEAIKEAVMNRVLKPKYIQKILDNWKTNGRNPSYNGKNKQGLAFKANDEIGGFYA